MIFCLLLVASFFEKLHSVAPLDNLCYQINLGLDNDCEYGRIPECKYDINSTTNIKCVVSSTTPNCYGTISLNGDCPDTCQKVTNTNATERSDICGYFGVILTNSDTNTCCIPSHSNESLGYDQRCESYYNKINCIGLTSLYGGKTDCHWDNSDGCKTILGPLYRYINGSCLPNSPDDDLVKACKDGEIEGCVFEGGQCKHKKSPKDIVDGGYYKIVNLASGCPSDQIKVPNGTNTTEINTEYRQHICIKYGLSTNETTTCCIPKLTEKSHLQNVTCDYYTISDTCEGVSPTTQKQCRWDQDYWGCLPEKYVPPTFPADRDGKQAIFNPDFKFLCDADHAGEYKAYEDVFKVGGNCVYLSSDMDDYCGVAALQSGHCQYSVCPYSSNLFWCDIFLNDTEKKKAVETGGCCAPIIPGSIPNSPNSYLSIIDVCGTSLTQGECSAYSKLAKSVTGFDNLCTFDDSLTRPTFLDKCYASYYKPVTVEGYTTYVLDIHSICRVDGVNEKNCDTDRPGCFWNATQEEPKQNPHIPVGHCHVDNFCSFSFSSTGRGSGNDCILKTIKNFDHPVCVGNHAIGKAVFAKKGSLNLDSADVKVTYNFYVSEGNDGKPHYTEKFDSECGVGINSNLIYKECPGWCPLKKGNNKKETKAICSEFGVKLSGSDDACCVASVTTFKNYDFGCHTANGSSDKCHLLKGVFGLDCAYNKTAKECQSCSKYEGNEEGCVSIGCGYSQSGRCTSCEVAGTDEEGCIVDRVGCCYDFKDHSGKGCKGYNDSSRSKDAVCDLDSNKLQFSSEVDECGDDYYEGLFDTGTYIQCLDKPKCCQSTNDQYGRTRCYLKKGVGKYMCDSPKDNTTIKASFLNCFLPHHYYSESESKSACDDDRCCLVDIAKYLKNYKLHDPAFFNIDGDYVATNISTKMCIPNFGGFKDVCDNKKPPSYKQFPLCRQFRIDPSTCELLSIFGCKYNFSDSECYHLNDARLEQKEKYPKEVEKASAKTYQVHRWGVAIASILLAVIAW